MLKRLVRNRRISALLGATMLGLVAMQPGTCNVSLDQGFLQELSSLVDQLGKLQWSGEWSSNQVGAGGDGPAATDGDNGNDQVASSGDSSESDEGSQSEPHHWRLGGGPRT